MPFIYLASPYTHKDPKVMRQRYEGVRDFVNSHMKVYQKPVLYSPIVHYHHMANECKLPYDAAFWENINFAMLQSATALWILKMPGYADSKGIFGNEKTKSIGEAKFAHQLGKEVKMIDY